MTNNLPPGPWNYMPNEHDDWGWLRDANGNVFMNTCGNNAADFAFSHRYGTPEYKAGPPQARAIAELLIRAEREADETRLTIEDVERMLGKECEDDMDTVDVANISFEASSDGIEVWRFNSSSADHVATIKTHGEFRTFCRLFGIEVGA